MLIVKLSQSPPAFVGSGHTLSGRPASQSSSPSASKGKAKASTSSTATTDHSWGASGQSLGARIVPREIGPVGAGGARAPRVPQRNIKQEKQKERSPSPDWGVDDDDVIMIDSD